MFTQESIAISWDENFKLSAVKLRAHSKGVELLESKSKQSSPSNLYEALKDIYESLNPADNTITILSGGAFNFSYKDLELPALKPELIQQSLAVQVEKHFPLSAASLSVSFRKVSQTENTALYRVLCVNREHWNSLLKLSTAIENGVDAIFPGFAILDTINRDLDVSFVGQEYYVAENGALENFGESSEQSPLGFELNQSKLASVDVSEHFESLILANYALSKNFDIDMPFLSPLPVDVKPKRFEKAKLLILAQVFLIVVVLASYGYSFVMTRTENAVSLKKVIAELDALAQEIQQQDQEISMFETAKSEFHNYYDDEKVKVAELIVEVTRKLPENYSVKSVNYSQKSKEMILSVRMEEGLATELTNSFNESEIFEPFPVFSDSMQRLTLKAKVKVEEE